MLTSMQVLDPSRIIVGSSAAVNGNSIYELDLTRLEFTYMHKFRAGAYDHGVSHLLISETGQIVCGHRTDGCLGSLDLRMGRRTGMPVKAHSGSILSMDIQGHSIITCGTTMDSRPDPFVKVYDMRRMISSVGGINCATSFVKFIPNTAEYRAVFVSSLGNFASYSNVHMGADGQVEQIDQIASGGGSVCALGISSVGRALSISDTCGYTHLWTDDAEWIDHARRNINIESKPLDPLPGPPDRTSDSLWWDEPQWDLATQATFVQGARLEILPSSLCDKTLTVRVPDEINPMLLEGAQSKQGLLWIETQEFVMNHALVFGKESNKKAYVHLFQDAEDAKVAGDIPGEFLKPKLKLSNIGLSDFDYGVFNKTLFAGLEGTIPNSFSNAVLQLLYFQGEVRSLLLQVVSDDPNDLATEAGFLFHMLDQARKVQSKNKCCEARNLLRTFRLAPDAQALGLLEPTELETDCRIGAFTRFLMEQFCRSSSKVKTELTKQFGVHFSHKEKWLTPGLDESSRSSMSLVLDIVYPSELSKAVATGARIPDLSFCDLLSGTLQQAKKTRLWNKQQNEQLPVLQTKEATKYPPCLLINCASHDNRSMYLPLWRQKMSKETFLPMYLILNNGAKRAVPVPVGQDPREAKGAVYELCAVVSHLYPINHVVAHIKIPSSYSNDHGWFLFNDFAVQSVLEETVRDFRMHWRNPCLVMYRQLGAKNEYTTTEAPLCSDRVFSSPSISQKKPSKPSFTKLSKLPSKGDLVAIDCEMVALSTEEAFVNSDGRKVVTQQSQLSLARVSCTTESELVFIDDYIVTPEPVVDYLTRFSGLVPGDLDPATSKHHLVPLRTAYVKLRYLVDRGCIFVGHGLMKDFRVINIFVPPEQILDTVHLFHMKSTRFLSLSFLASVLLGLDIQSKTHDSIEDARTALMVYKQYKTFADNGTLDAKIKEIYDQGRQRNFR